MTGGEIGIALVGILIGGFLGYNLGMGTVQREARHSTYALDMLVEQLGKLLTHLEQQPPTDLRDVERHFRVGYDQGWRRRGNFDRELMRRAVAGN
jgi:hypothetical protein